jgi:hypothetical protein
VQVARTEPHRLWVGHIPDEAAKKGLVSLEGRLGKLCGKFGDIMSVDAHPRFGDVESSRVHDLSWGCAHSDVNTSTASLNDPGNG